MSDYVLLVGIPELLESRGPGHRASFVAWCEVHHRWEEPMGSDLDCRHPLVEPYAFPLFWAGKPCFPAIDAACRLLELYINANRRYMERGVVKYRQYLDVVRSTDYAGCLALANELVKVMGKGEVVDGT